MTGPTIRDEKSDEVRNGLKKPCGANEKRQGCCRIVG